MSFTSIKGRLVEVLYDSISSRIVRSEIELGDRLYCRFDEGASCVLYINLKAWCSTQADPSYGKNEGMPRFVIDLDPAFVSLRNEQVKALYEDFTRVLMDACIPTPDDPSGEQ